MTSIVSNTLLSFFFSFSFSPCASLVPRIQSMHIRPLGSCWLSTILVHHLGCAHAGADCNARPTSLPSLLLLGVLMPPGEPRRAVRMGSGVVQPILCDLPPFPGRPFKGVERGSQNKSPR